MIMVCAGFQLLEAQFGGLLCGCNFKFQQCGIYFYYSGSIRLLPDWVFQNYVAHGVPSRPTNPARWATRSPAVSLFTLWDGNRTAIFGPWHGSSCTRAVPVSAWREILY